MSRYLVGIDLGTTNTVVAYADRATESQAITLFEIEQLVAPGQVAARPALASLRYHPAAGELRTKDVGLPWPQADVAGMPQVVAGSLARDLGARVPGRLVASAKSWLSHTGVDRTAAILPWGAPGEVIKVSPVVACAGYLAHVRAAWNHRFPEHPLETQETVLTVPASFDEGARALTVQAAEYAGLPGVRLLEEPQAAFYDWLFRHRDRLDAELEDTRLVLVCDVGGGTTDLTLIRVQPGPSGPQMTRVGVGDHLMLGGDNMDLGLAHVAEGRLTDAGARLGTAQMSQLIQQCRSAKERLLAPRAPEETAVTVLGAGAGLIGGARSARLGRAEVQAMVVDGFFPAVAPDARPQRVRGGIVEFGLPYVADPAVTRHVAAFLGHHARASREALGPKAPSGDRLAVPDALLLNGGVFRSQALAERLLEVLGDWRGAPLRVLNNEDPDAAVARGGVAYGLARAGTAPAIGGGSARSYFLALEAGDRQRGVCVLPRGSAQGHEVRLSDRTFALRLGEPVRFHLLSATADTVYAPGQLVELGSEGFVSLPPIATVVSPGTGAGAREVPVQIVTALTEVGTLEMHCASIGDTGQRWKLEFELRGEAARVAPGVAAELHPRFGEAAACIDRIYGDRSQRVDAKAVKRLVVDLEKILGKRERWDTPLLRELFGSLWERARRRRRSGDHERVWLNLAGYCLRPGFGYPLDDWRVEQLWTLFGQGVQFVPEGPVWSAWWNLWQRTAGGLSPQAQVRILDDIAFYLQPPGRIRRPAGVKKQGYAEMVRLGASLEHVPAVRKAEIGEWLLERLRKPAESPQSWWALGRVGAREPFYGSAHNVLAVEVAARWLGKILALDWRKVEPAAFAATLIARMTGDRERDIDETLRRQVVDRLQSVKAPPSWITMVREVAALGEAEQGRVFGDSLPPGLKLVY